MKGGTSRPRPPGVQNPGLTRRSPLKGADNGSVIDAGMAATDCGRPGWFGLVPFGHGGWDSVGWEGVALAHGDEAR